MPLENFHVVRLREPSDFNPDTFRTTGGRTIYGRLKVPSVVNIVWAKLKGQDKLSDYPIPQSLKFPVSEWKIGRVRRWLDHNNVKHIKVEPASQ